LSRSKRVLPFSLKGDVSPGFAHADQLYAQTFIDALKRALIAIDGAFHALF